MVILPSIDLKDSKCVRLYKGDFDTVHEVAEDPLAVAEDFAKAGAEMIHTVDLDGALNGQRKNAGIIKQLAGSSGLRLEMGGGIRTMEDLDAVYALGVWRMVIGSAAVTDRDFVSAAVKKYGGERIAVGIDARNGRVRTHGWTVDSGLEADIFAREMELLGVKTIIYTDIETDGTLSGPPFESLKLLRSQLNCDLIASGGVSCLQDIEALKSMGIDGVIIGKAYYAGKIDLKKAVELGER